MKHDLNIARNSAGFTLVEALIGLGLASAIQLGVNQLFVANSNTYNLLVGQSAMQESGRFALGVISRSVQASGYKGCFSTNADVHKTFLADIPYEFNLDAPIIGYEGEASGWSPNIETRLPKTVGTTDTNVYKSASIGAGTGIDTTTILRSTDIITLNYLPQKRHRLAVAMPTNTADIQTASTQFDFSAEHIAYLHDCEKQTFFRVTGITGDLLKHGTSSDPDGYTNVNSIARFGSFNDQAYVSAITSETYYIAPSTSANNDGRYPMSLWRKAGLAKPTELVDGIEDLQIKYGIDTDNDRVPNRYVNADAVIDFDDVRALRITVVATSINNVDATTSPTHGCTTAIPTPGLQYCKPGTETDGMLRRSFSQTVALRNGRS